MGEIGRITSFAAIGETLFAGASEESIFRSTDNGLTWTRMDLPEDITTFIPNNINAFPPIGINALAAIGGNLFAGTKCDRQAPFPCGIFRSTDNGKNWTWVGKGVAATTIHSLAVIGTELFAGEYGVLRSSDLGNIWTEIEATRDTPYGFRSDMIFNALQRRFGQGRLC